METLNEKINLKKNNTKALIFCVRKMWKIKNVDIKIIPQSEIKNEVDNFNGIKSLFNIIKLSNVTLNQKEFDYIFDEMIENEDSMGYTGDLHK